MKFKEPETRTTYYLKPGQTLKNTKIADRSLALIVPQQVYSRFNEYGFENERIALLAEKEAKRLAALKEAGREMLEAQGLKNHYEKETIDRRKKKDEETVEFMKMVKAQKAKEHAEIVKEAREKIFQNVSQCRSFNRALLVSECLKELEEQIKFQNSIKNIHQKIDNEYAQSVMKDVEKFHEEERLKSEVRLKKIQNCKLSLEKQIKENREKLSATSEAIKKQELEDMENTAKEIKELNDKELAEGFRKKEALKKMFLGAIEEKKLQDLKIERENQFGMKVLQTYNALKSQMEKMTKEKTRHARQEKINATENLVRKVTAKKKIDAAESQDNAVDKEAERREKEALEKIAEKKRKKEKMRQEMIEQQKLFEKNIAKQKKEEMDLMVWEMQQRYYRDQFYKNWSSQQTQNEKNKRSAYGKLLKIQMKDNEITKKKKEMEEDAVDLIWRKEMLEKCNERVLAYGEKILKDSEGVRPIYPIVKALQQFKKEAGLLHENIELTADHPTKIIRNRGKRPACTRPIKEENQFYFA